jgi:hypothetical protein
MSIWLSQQLLAKAVRLFFCKLRLSWCYWVANRTGWFHSTYLQCDGMRVMVCTFRASWLLHVDDSLERTLCWASDVIIASISILSPHPIPESLTLFRILDVEKIEKKWIFTVVVSDATITSMSALLDRRRRPYCSTIDG